MTDNDEQSIPSRGSHRVGDGVGCKCEARSEAECGCDADWTPQEIYDLRAENERLREAIRHLADQDATLSVCDGAVTVTMDATLTADERRAIDWAATMLEHGSLPKSVHRTDAETLRSLLERLQ